MYIAKLSLICLVAFAFMVGCGMIGEKAEMSSPATSPMDGAAMKSEAKSASDIADAVEEAAVEEITLNVTGMTWGSCTSAVQSALSAVPGVSKVVSVSDTTNTAVVKVEKGKVATDALIKAVESDKRFKATVAN